MKFDVPSQVIDILFKQGYENQLLDIVMANENNSNVEVSDIPISPESIGDSGEKIIISQNVYEMYREMLHKICNSETAEEIPFFLLGNRKEICDQSCVVFDKMIVDLDNAKSELSVSINTEYFQKLLADDKYEIISIGHTHGNVSEEKKNQTLARTLPKDIKEQYSIRDAGLNISVADIWQHEAFKEIAKQSSTKDVYQTVIMYNGDIVVINSSAILKSNNIETVFDNGDIINISSDQNDKDSNKQRK